MLKKVRNTSSSVFISFGNLKQSKWAGVKNCRRNVLWKHKLTWQIHVCEMPDMLVCTALPVYIMPYTFQYPGTWHEATESINFKKMEFSSHYTSSSWCRWQWWKATGRKQSLSSCMGTHHGIKGDSLTAASPSEEFKPQQSFRTARMNGRRIYYLITKHPWMVVQELWPTVQEAQSQSDCLHPGQTWKRTRIPKRLRRRDLLKTQQWLKHGTQHLNCLDKIHPTAIHHIWRHQMCKSGVSARKRLSDGLNVFLPHLNSSSTRKLLYGKMKWLKVKGKISNCSQWDSG